MSDRRAGHFVALCAATALFTAPAHADIAAPVCSPPPAIAELPGRLPQTQLSVGAEGGLLTRDPVKLTGLLRLSLLREFGALRDGLFRAGGTSFLQGGYGQPTNLWIGGEFDFRLADYGEVTRRIFPAVDLTLGTNGHLRGSGGVLVDVSGGLQLSFRTAYEPAESTVAVTIGVSIAAFGSFYQPPPETRTVAEQEKDLPSGYHRIMDKLSLLLWRIKDDDATYDAVCRRGSEADATVVSILDSLVIQLRAQCESLPERPKKECTDAATDVAKLTENPLVACLPPSCVARAVERSLYYDREPRHVCLKTDKCQ